MKSLLSICLIAITVPLFAETPTVSEIVNRARATVGAEAVLDGLVTLRMTGGIEPADAKLPEATIMIIARKPGSQRLEVKVDDLVETTILCGAQGCIIRTNLNDKASQMRGLSAAELERVVFSSRQFFSFFRADFKNGERITYDGIEQRRGVRCHKLVYTYPNGLYTTRYFAVNDDVLVSTITDVGIESVEVGEQFVEGIRFPKKIEYYENNAMLHTVVLTGVAVNKPLESGIFTIPKGQQK
jgi:hypothetical protein